MEYVTRPGEGLTGAKKIDILVYGSQAIGVSPSTSYVPCQLQQGQGVPPDPKNVHEKQKLERETGEPKRRLREGI
jgi:hypothetical protein